MKVKITDRLINEGEVNSEFCPIALFLHDNGYPKAKVNPDVVFLDGDLKNPTRLSQDAVEFIEDFDRWADQCDDDYPRPEACEFELLEGVPS